MDCSRQCYCFGVPYFKLCFVYFSANTQGVHKDFWTQSKLCYKFLPTGWHYCCPTLPSCRRGSNAAAPSVRRQNDIVEQGHFVASPTTLIGEGGWRSQLYRFLGLLRSPPLVYVAYISPSLPGDRPYEWMWYKFCAASDPTEMSAHLARWQQGGERQSEREAACQIDCMEEGRRGGRVVAPWEVFIYAGHVAPQPNSRKKTSLGSWDGS